MNDILEAAQALITRLEEKKVPSDAQLGEAIANLKTSLARQAENAASPDIYRTVASKDAVDGEIEVDEGAIVSHGSNAGAYVESWQWISDDQVCAHLATYCKDAANEIGFCPAQRAIELMIDADPECEDEARDVIDLSVEDRIEFLLEHQEDTIQALSDQLTEIYDQARQPQRPTERPV